MSFNLHSPANYNKAAEIDRGLKYVKSSLFVNSPVFEHSSRRVVHNAWISYAGIPLNTLSEHYRKGS